MFPLMFVCIISSLVSVAKWPSFGKELPNWYCNIGEMTATTTICLYKVNLFLEKT